MRLHYFFKSKQKYFHLRTCSLSQRVKSTSSQLHYTSTIKSLNTTGKEPVERAQSSITYPNPDHICNNGADLDQVSGTAQVHVHTHTHTGSKLVKRRIALSGMAEPGGLSTPLPQFQAKNKKLSNQSSISELQDFKIFWGRITQAPLHIGTSGARL